jgi:hypothetical protein
VPPQLQLGSYISIVEGQLRRKIKSHDNMDKKKIVVSKNALREAIDAQKGLGVLDLRASVSCLVIPCAI